MMDILTIIISDIEFRVGVHTNTISST